MEGFVLSVNVANANVNVFLFGDFGGWRLRLLRLRLEAGGR